MQDNQRFFLRATLIRGNAHYVVPAMRGLLEL
ncbi:hypothetical protein PMI18_00454 [Pseudomonas sp. GM102]|nr:hypothetical protein PMI18_00454 [Pseudomonas sp. GM102]